MRAIRTLTDEVLASLIGRLEVLYARVGRPSIPPEMLLRATLLQAFFSIRSERMLMEQINCNLLFRWFVGLSMDADVRHPTGFTHNRDRLLEADVARDFLSALMSLAKVKRLMSSEHFSVDGTLIDAWASMKSFRPKDGSGEVFGWIKAQAGFTKVKVRGRPKVAAVFGFAIAGYNLVRLPKLLAEAAA